MVAVTIFYSFLLGATVGSFLGAAFFRIKNKQSMRGRSRCPNCGKQIEARNNIPILSFIILRGRTSCCKTRISSDYFWFEIFFALLFVLAGIFLGLVNLFLISAIIILLIFIISEFVFKKENKN